MYENCLAYFQANSDKYEIASSGVYWLQGESDEETDPVLYTERFMAIWDRLKAAGMEYVAFFRVRRGPDSDPAPCDNLSYTSALSAQIKMINSNPDFYMASDITENWTGSPSAEHTVKIANYITMMESYGQKPTYSDEYGNEASYADGELTVTMKSLYGSNNKCHYGKFGYGIIGADAAYNMYKAFHSRDVRFVAADTSGYAESRHVIADGQEEKIDISDMNENLTFRADCGSTAGTLDVAVYSGKSDITDTEGIFVPSGSKYNSISTEKLKEYLDVSIELEYTKRDGSKAAAKCIIIN